jgi:Icc protein
MRQSFRILQISDPHLSPDGGLLKGIDTRRQFADTLSKLAGERWDALVLSGDLAADEGEIESYAWLKQSLAGFPCPYYLMAGNHDRAETLRQVFGIPENLDDGMLYYRAEIKGTPVFFLDTSDYTLPRRQLDWLVREIADCDGEALLFMHHPPVLCGCRFMDQNYPLRNIAECWPVLREIPVIRHIFCGHYHTAKTLSIDGKLIHLCPSTMMQIDPHVAEFAIQHTRPGWRVIEWDGEELYTTVHHLP